MSRLLLTALTAGLLLTCVATAQAPEDGCSQASPCDWVVDVDQDGFLDVPPGGWTFGQGDWVQVNIFNLDFTEASHTITVDGYNLSWTVGPYQEHISEPFQFHLAGAFSIQDAPSGDSAAVTIEETEPIVEEEEPRRRIPAVSVLVSGLVIAAVGASRRP